jgi:hypothetical protein
MPVTLAIDFSRQTSTFQLRDLHLLATALTLRKTEGLPAATSLRCVMPKTPLKRPDGFCCSASLFCSISVTRPYRGPSTNELSMMVYLAVTGNGATPITHPKPE